MLLENILLGRTLEIYVDRDGYRYRLVSKVEQTSVRRVCVTAITAGGRAFKFRADDKIRLVYRDDEQMWEWLGVKAGIAKLEGEPVHYFDIVNKGRSFNRRQAYRVNIDEDVEFGYYEIPGSSERFSYLPLVTEEYETASDSEGTEQKKFVRTGAQQNSAEAEMRMRMVPMKDALERKYKGHIRDISETGLGIFSDARLHIDDNFYVHIPSDYGPLLTRCTVIRSDDRSSENRKYRYYYGCVYTESDQKLIRYIYDVQRKKIQKNRERREFEASLRARGKGRK